MEKDQKVIKGQGDKWKPAIEKDPMDSGENWGSSDTPSNSGGLNANDVVEETPSG